MEVKVLPGFNTSMLLSLAVQSQDFFMRKITPTYLGLCLRLKCFSIQIVLYSQDFLGSVCWGSHLRSYTTQQKGWRTMLVIPELEKEVQLLRESRDTRKELQFLRSERDRIEDEIHHL